MTACTDRQRDRGADRQRDRKAGRQAQTDMPAPDMSQH